MINNERKKYTTLKSQNVKKTITIIEGPLEKHNKQVTAGRQLILRPMLTQPTHN
jgi:hypothetical protein